MLDLAGSIRNDTEIHRQQVSWASEQERTALRTDFDALQKNILSAIQQQCSSEVTMGMQDMTRLAERVSTLEGVVSAQAEHLARLQASASAGRVAAGVGVVGGGGELWAQQRRTRRSWDREDAGDTVVAVCMLGTDGLVCDECLAQRFF